MKIIKLCNSRASERLINAILMENLSLFAQFFLALDTYMPGWHSVLMR